MTIGVLPDPSFVARFSVVFGGTGWAPPTQRDGGQVRLWRERGAGMAPHFGGHRRARGACRTL